MRLYYLTSIFQFGGVLYDERCHRNLKQEEVADMARVSRAFVSMLETGNKRNLTLDTALRLLDALGCEVIIRRKVP